MRPVYYSKDYSFEAFPSNVCLSFPTHSLARCSLEGSIFLDIRINRTPTLKTISIYEWAITILYFAIVGFLLLATYTALQLLISTYDVIVLITMEQNRGESSSPVMIVANIIIDDVSSGTVCVSLLHIQVVSTSDANFRYFRYKRKFGLGFKLEADLIDLIAISTSIAVHIPLDVEWTVSRIISSVKFEDVFSPNIHLTTSPHGTNALSMCISNFRMIYLFNRPHFRDKSCVFRAKYHPGTVGTYLLVINGIEKFISSSEASTGGDGKWSQLSASEVMDCLHLALHSTVLVGGNSWVMEEISNCGGNERLFHERNIIASSGVENTNISRIWNHAPVVTDSRSFICRTSDPEVLLTQDPTCAFTGDSVPSTGDAAEAREACGAIAENTSPGDASSRTRGDGSVHQHAWPHDNGIAWGETCQRGTLLSCEHPVVSCNTEKESISSATLHQSSEALSPICLSVVGFMMVILPKSASSNNHSNHGGVELKWEHAIVDYYLD